MPDEQLPYLLGYPASFCMTPDEARGNILRMIEAEIPGWDGGAGRWAGRLREQLARPNRTRKLNRFGAKFSAVEWVWVMRSLLMDCERRLLLASGGESGDRALLEEAAPRHESAGREGGHRDGAGRDPAGRDAVAREVGTLTGDTPVSARDPDPDDSPHGTAELLFPHGVSA